MSWLLQGGVARVTDESQISVVKDLPIGVYEVVYSLDGAKLVRSSISSCTEKVYGEAIEFANQIVESFERSPKTKNLGVLMSGAKGLGKTLTLKLVVDKLKDTHPVVLVRDNGPGLETILNSLEGAVVVMDEFEKVFPDSSNADADVHTQDSLLSILDGTAGKAGNLFIMTVNYLHMINDNLISRPGRIRYHYKFSNAKESVIREYCQDNLDDKTKIDDVVEYLLSTRGATMDVMAVVVSEVNRFPEKSVTDALKYINLIVESFPAVVAWKAQTPDGIIEGSCRCNFKPNSRDLGHFTIRDFNQHQKYQEVDEERWDGDTITIIVDTKGIYTLPFTGAIDLKNHFRVTGKDCECPYNVEDVKILELTMQDVYAMNCAVAYNSDGTLGVVPTYDNYIDFRD